MTGVSFLCHFSIAVYLLWFAGYTFVSRTRAAKLYTFLQLFTVLLLGGFWCGAALYIAVLPRAGILDTTLRSFNYAY